MRRYTLSDAHLLLGILRARREVLLKTYRHPSPDEIAQHFARANTDLLARAREFVAGCGRPSDEPCDCRECEAATALLDEIDAYIEKRAVGVGGA